MREFSRRHAGDVNGVLSGFDRVRLRGTLRWLSSVRGMMNYLSLVSVLLKDFKKYAQHCTTAIRAATVELALTADRPLQYVGSSATRKETIAREIAVRDHIESGLICVLTCVEPCYSFEVGPNRQQKRLELRYGPSRCRHDSFYVLDPQLFPEYPIPYYWSVAESEWATDVLFRSPEALAAVYPNLVRHSLLNIHSADVMRFLGRRMA